MFAAADGAPLLASTPVQDGHYYALSPFFPASAAPERMVRDLWGHVPDGATDERPWLDHGHWGQTRPLAPRPGPPPPAAEPAFRRANPALMRWPIGPLTGLPTEPVHLRVHTGGEIAAAVEARLGYAHKGALTLMRGKSPRTAARFAARLSADATVANSLAFACAAEAALGLSAPLRAAVLRGVMAEWERIATHLGDLAACCPAGGFATHREHMLRAAGQATGHRMMMDCVMPGGLAGEIDPTALMPPLQALQAELPRLSRQIEGLGEGIGRIPEAALAAYDPAGVVARSSGRASDARAMPGYAPYLDHKPASQPGADVAARMALRLSEIAASIALIMQWLRGVPPGATAQALPTGSGEGCAVVESPRGALWYWMRLEGGLIASAFAADPSWRHWPLQEAASANAALQHLPLIDASFANARSGIDL